VRHDKSGRAIWEWAVDTGRHALDSTSRLLKRLELPGLALEEDVKRKKAQEQEQEQAQAQAAGAGRQVPTFGGPRETDPLAGRRGFNPYDSRQPAPGKVAAQASRAAVRTTAPSSASSKEPGLFSRLFGARR
jgi:hypothetical protein